MNEKSFDIDANTEKIQKASQNKSLKRGNIQISKTLV